MTPEISIVTPVYRSADNLPELVSRILASARIAGIPLEIILVDDGSPDNSWEIIQALAKQHKEVRGVRLSCNNGQHRAILTGLNEIRGSAVVVMDSDLQDPPEDIVPMYKVFCINRPEAVCAQRDDQHLLWYKSFMSSVFYRFLHWISGVSMRRGVANFGVYDAVIIKKITEAYAHKYFFFPLAVRRQAKRIEIYPVLTAKRFAGRSAYSFRKVCVLAVSILMSQTFLAFLLTYRQKKSVISERTATYHDPI